MNEYIPSTRRWVAEHVELYEGSGGTEGSTLNGIPVIIVTNRGWKTGAIRKTPLMRVVEGNNYTLVASIGGAPKHPLWYHNLKANPNVEIRDGTHVYSMRVREVEDSSRETAALGHCSRSISSLSGLPGKNRPRNPCLPFRSHRIGRRMPPFAKYVLNARRSVHNI